MCPQARHHAPCTHDESTLIAHPLSVFHVQARCVHSDIPSSLKNLSLTAHDADLSSCGCPAGSMGEDVSSIASSSPGTHAQLLCRFKAASLAASAALSVLADDGPEPAGAAATLPPRAGQRVGAWPLSIR
eukprot:CAMPEP_0181226696 /NCGR_PEP_ID=MMETSP1096-20121128/32393_1 /TAXON_ID=156174 ORGANISM="Chrysochromulina ericina, Strain CCMP281" /NCGR_SAMPLE_ID=MMETSP1096 /ASSEMBLY_ACC=CAM_ASM_000453 /LENGTH=129 /DNA_ID=CAMNT_0023320053 /DNA_START=493 /DNA_END=882 /DNA_ORIENTATION=+